MRRVETRLHVTRDGCQDFLIADYALVTALCADISIYPQPGFFVWPSSSITTCIGADIHLDILTFYF